MSIDDLEENWDTLGGLDPMWAILNEPRARGVRWSEDEFFATGVDVTQEVVEYVRSLVSDLPTTRALDFGCGIGRLTQALAGFFTRVDGVDIAASMIEHARETNAWGDACQYWHNPSNDLSLFSASTFDFVLTELVLQHMPPELMFHYVTEFSRILKPGGVAVFDVPRRLKWTPKAIGLRVLPAPVVRVLRRRMHGGAVMDLHFTGRNEVIAFLQGLEVEIIGDRPLRRFDPGVKRHQYAVRKFREAS